MIYGRPLPHVPAESLPVWADAQSTPGDLYAWLQTGDGIFTVGRLEHASIAILSQELHAVHMQIHGILALPAGVPMGSFFVEPPPRHFRPPCDACRDEAKEFCDYASCPRGNFVPAAIEGNKRQRIKRDLIPKCSWILKTIRVREARLRAAALPPPSSSTFSGSLGDTSQEDAVSSENNRLTGPLRGHARMGRMGPRSTSSP